MDILGLIYINDWFLLFSCLMGGLYVYSTWRSDYWEKQGVPGPKPLPFYLSLIYFVLEGLKYDSRLVKEHGKTTGAFEGRKPYLITTDDDVLREVLVKQFPNFTNKRKQGFPEKSGFAKSLLLLEEDDGWKRVRDLMSPTFSPGKLKQLTGAMNECSITFVREHEKVPGQGHVVNLKESFGDVGMSLIATVAFGIDMKNKEIYSKFQEMGQRIQGNQRGIKLALQILNFIAPKLTTWFTNALNIDIMDYVPFQYFGKIVDQILETRTKGDKPLDFIQLMANAHTDDDSNKKGSVGMTREEVVANGITFFLAGFDTMSSVLSSLCYQLAINPEAQEKAYEEISEILDKKDHIDYDDLHQLKYLDWCLHEALRLIPIALKLERRAKEDITIKGINIEKDMLISIPVLQIHFDEERWENPHVFRPERFSEEEKKNRSPFSWLPFGYGPRNCVAMRLAIVEIKIVAAHLLYNFRLERCSKTKVPLEIHKFGMVKEGMDVKMVKRTKS